MTQTHKYQVGQVVAAKASGKLYKVVDLRGLAPNDNHHKLKGGIGYTVIGQRDGRCYGPLRLMPESSLVEYC